MKTAIKKPKKKKASPFWQPEGRTSIPPYHSELETLKKMLTDYRMLSMLMIDASNLNRVEKNFGKHTYQNLLNLLNGLLIDLRGHVIRKEDILTGSHPGGDQFFIFLSKKKNAKKFTSSDLERLSQRIQQEINSRIFKETFPYLKGRSPITVGQAVIIYNPLVQEERLIQRLMEDAKTMARFQKFKEEIQNKERLQELIIKEEINIVFQPIFNLNTHQIIGYEALSRGPEGTEYENPHFLFDTAREAGLEFELDRICRKKALTQASRLDPQTKIFINCLPTTIHDAEFIEAYSNDFLEDSQRIPNHVLMEISEKQVINHCRVFQGTLSRHAELGFSIEIDDSGAGYAGLEAIVELQPSFLKLDISMIRGIEKNLLKQGMIQALVSFSGSINSQIIAEGIETQDELGTLKNLGISLGQGFLLARPA